MIAEQRNGGRGIKRALRQNSIPLPRFLCLFHHEPVVSNVKAKHSDTEIGQSFRGHYLRGLVRLIANDSADAGLEPDDETAPENRPGIQIANVAIRL